mmetsp:Transcript_91824/g.262947  ORF Transcript_91824/g.262947 Transcript_91824/m.262947 type:complete len:376 (-) Transcript_91824:107-1234(-)
MSASQLVGDGVAIEAADVGVGRHAFQLLLVDVFLVLCRALQIVGLQSALHGLHDPRGEPLQRRRLLQRQPVSLRLLLAGGEIPHLQDDHRKLRTTELVPNVLAVQIFIDVRREERRVLCRDFPECRRYPRHILLQRCLRQAYPEHSSRPLGHVGVVVVLVDLAEQWQHLTSDELEHLAWIRSRFPRQLHLLARSPVHAHRGRLARRRLQEHEAAHDPVLLCQTAEQLLQRGRSASHEVASRAPRGQQPLHFLLAGGDGHRKARPLDHPLHDAGVQPAAGVLLVVAAREEVNRRVAVDVVSLCELNLDGGIDLRECDAPAQRPGGLLKLGPEVRAMAAPRRVEGHCQQRVCSQHRIKGRGVQRQHGALIAQNRHVH